MTSLTDTQVITASGGLVELGYAESNANLSISATTGAGMDNISPELTVVCDGSPVMVEFFCATARATTSGSGTTDALWFTLKVDGSVEVERLGTVGNVTTSYGSLTPIKLSHRMTPSAGSHTFRIGGWVSNAARTGYIGGGSPYPPAWIRVSKIVEATQWPAVTTGTIICTSSTRPASPFEGQQIYETDTKKEMTYDGSGWYAFNQVIGKSLQTSATTTGSTQVDVAGLSATVAYAANRTIKVSATFHPYYASTATDMIVRLFHGATQVNQFVINKNGIGTSPASSFGITHYVTTSSASSSTTFKMQLVAYGSSNTVGLYGSGGEAGVFIVEDIGPA